MVETWQQVQNYSDQWALWRATAVARMAGLDPKCFQFRMIVAPRSGTTLGTQNDPQVLGPGGYAQFGVRIKPGSFIWGLAAYVPVGGTVYTFNITDTSLEHTWFSSAMPSSSPPDFFPTLYPVVGDGGFMVEVWNPVLTAGTSQRCFIILFVAEARDIPVGSRQGRRN